MGDPDGGGETCLVTLATRALPVLPTNGRTLQVVPGTGGGDGSAANPFKGIAAAQAAARPGDIMLLVRREFDPVEARRCSNDGHELASERQRFSYG